MKSAAVVLLSIILIGPADLSAQQGDVPDVPVLGHEVSVVPGKPVNIGYEFQIDSKHVNETRTVSVYVPASHSDSGTRYPVIYVLDGEALFLHASSTVRSLSRLGLMPEAIVVAIHNSQRRRDMTPPFISLPDVPTGGADPFLSFLEEEVVPYIEERYRTQPLRILIGHSHGALLSSYALMARPELFRWHLALDAPVHLSDRAMEKKIDTFLTSNPDHVGRLVTIDNVFGWSEAGWNSLVAKAPTTFHTARLALPDETHESMYFVATYKGLKELFYDFGYDNSKVQTVQELQETYDARSLSYGFQIPIPQRALLDFAEENILIGQPDRAASLLDKAVDLYGETSRSQRLEAELRYLVDNPIEETSEELLASEPASPLVMAPFLGIWEGLLHGQIPAEVTFAIEDGEVKGRTVQTLPDGSKGVFEHVLARVRDDNSLEWGYMNKMRPYSLVLAYRAVLVDKNTLHAKGIITLSVPPERLGGLDSTFILKRKD